MHADLTDPGDYLDTVSLFFEVELATDQLIDGASTLVESTRRTSTS